MPSGKNINDVGGILLWADGQAVKKCLNAVGIQPKTFGMI